MKAIKTLLILVQLTVAPVFTYGQYFQKLHDCDSSYDWGWDIFLRPDNNYIVFGWGINQITGQRIASNMIISANGDTVLSRHVLAPPNTTIAHGNPAQIKQIATGYISSLNVQRPRGSYLSSQAGVVKYSAIGDTVFMKTYTDTSIYFDLLSSCAVTNDGGYLLAGGHGTNIPSYYPGYIIRTDSLGDSVWTHTYRLYSDQVCEINNVFEIDGGRIVAGGHSRYTYFASSTAYYHYIPWFLVLDNRGNIIRDTVLGRRYGGGGAIYKDLNGGYMHWGRIDTLAEPGFSDIRNFPYYISHLDTNFNITWEIDFTYWLDSGQRIIHGIQQLKDSSYIVLGDEIGHSPAGSCGWAAKINRRGEMVWNHYYWSDTTEDAIGWAYIRDMVELPNGNLVFVGATCNDSLPSWHQNRDTWLICTDSNGCELPGCRLLPPPLSVNETPIPPVTDVLQLYPNPNSGSFTVAVSQEGIMRLHSMDGRELGNWAVHPGSNNMELPLQLSPGMYLATYKPNAGQQQVVRFMYQP